MIGVVVIIAASRRTHPLMFPRSVAANRMPSMADIAKEHQ
jgi:hypothetical protein